MDELKKTRPKVWIGWFRHVDDMGEEYEHMILAVSEEAAKKHIVIEAMNENAFGWDTEEHLVCSDECILMCERGEYTKAFDRINAEKVPDAGFENPIELVVYEQEVLD